MPRDPIESGCERSCVRRSDVEVPSDSARRRFVSTAVLASVGAFLAACGDGIIGGVGPASGCGTSGGTRGEEEDDDGGSGTCATPLPTGGLRVTLASFPALAADGGIARVDGGTTTPIAAVRVNATTYRAFSMSCTHAGTTVNIVGGAFSCPNHGAQFSATGAVTRGPASTPLREYTVVFSASAGTLTIT